MFIFPKIKMSADITLNRVEIDWVKIPLIWSWRLLEATPAQRTNYQFVCDGYGVHWPDIDEDISAEGMLYGTPAPRPPRLQPA